MEVEGFRELGSYTLSGPKEQRFSPYSFNGGLEFCLGNISKYKRLEFCLGNISKYKRLEFCLGNISKYKRSVLAVAGEDFAVIASDSRLSEGFSIHTRDQPKTYQLTKNTVVGSCGFHGDVLTLIKVLQARIKMYLHEHNTDMSTTAVAAMLATILYYRRFFPYYVYNIVAGIDDEGKGCVFSFDPVGSYERETFRAGGSASSMLQPLMDNQIGYKNMPKQERTPLSKEEVVKIVKDGFISAAERDIYTGDSVVVNIVTKDGVEVERYPLRKD